MKRITFTLLFFVLAIFVKAQTKPSVNIIFDGDSQTSLGFYPAKILELLALNGYISVRNVNYAVSGQITSQMVNDVSSQVVPRYSSSYNQNIVIYYIGYNDSYIGSSVNTGLMRDYLVTYYNKLKSAGFKVIMVNLPDGQNRGGINVINSMYASEYSKISDVFVNCRESSGVFENYTNSTYFSDGVHLSTTGYNYLAEHYVYPKLSQLLSSVTPPTPPSTSPDLNSGLRNYYKLDETSGDAIDSKSANNGKVSTGISRGSGKISGGFYFDGNSDYVALPSAITLKSSSYSFWINISSISDDLLILASDAHSSRIFVGANNNLKIETNTNSQEFDFYNSFSMSTWYNVVLTRDNNTVKFYRNGSLMGSTTINGSDGITLSQIGFNGRSFRGTIDEVGIWTRPLSQDEVTLLYNSGSGRSYPFGTTSTVAVTGVSVNPSSTSVSIGSSVTLLAEVSPSNATNKTVTWKSSNTAIATVNTNGVITGLSSGTTTIAATTQDGTKVASSQVTVTSVESTTSLTSGLSLYYKFDETSGTAIDEAGSNGGTVSSDVKRGAPGKINGAYFFDSNNDYVLIPSLLTHKTASYAFWINISGITDDLLIMGNDAHYSRIFIGRNNNLKIETNTNGQEFAFYNSFSTGIWYYVVMTRTDHTVKLYLNGKYIGSMTISGSDNLSLSQIGFKGKSFKGTIDELGIWNRALTDADVSVLYNKGNGLSFPFSTQSFSATNQSIDEDVMNTAIIPTNLDNAIVKSMDPATDGFFYPNPAGDNLHFNNIISAQAQVSIYDMHGRKVIAQQIVGHSADISSLAKGVYLVKLTDNGKTLIHKLMKE
jgi:uncharacterized protein YjdB